MCLQIGGFPSTYIWRYSVTQAATPFSLSSNPSTGLAYGFNYPQSTSGIGWTVLSDVYDAFIVRHSFAKCTVTNKSTTVSYRVNLVPVDSNIILYPPVSDSALVSNPFSVTTELGPLGSINTAVVESSIPVHKFFGLKKPMDQFADSYTGYTGSANSTHSYANPTSTAFWSLSISSSDGSAIPATTIYVNVSFIYEIIFFERLPLY
jgi:hypothetical protein